MVNDSFYPGPLGGGEAGKSSLFSSLGCLIPAASMFSLNALPALETLGTRAVECEGLVL